MNQTLERFKEYTQRTKKHTCTNNFKEGIKLLPTSYALNYNYISVADYETQYIALDIDRATSITQLVKDYGMPEPTIAVFSKEKRTAHILYELIAPVSHQQKSKKKPQKLLEVVKQDLIIVSDADSQFTGKHIKNPLSKHWAVETSNNTYNLKDFLEINPVINRTYQNITKRTAQQEEGRNCYVFEQVRFKAYRAVHSFSCSTDFSKYIAEECSIASQEASDYFGKPLMKSNEIRQIVKSISEWTWKNRDKIDGKNRGIMDLPPINAEEYTEEEHKEVIRSRQKEGAIYTASIKSDKTMEAINNAIQALGSNATKKAIAEHTGMNYRTIRRYI